MKIKLIIMALLYFNMTCQITIGQVQFDTVHSVKITESIKSLDTTATLVLPKNFKEAKTNGRRTDLESKPIIDFIAVGDSVDIKLGYDDDLQTEFKGYVSRISSDVPLMIECEDEMWQLKQGNINKTIKNIKLSELIDLVAPSYEKEITADLSFEKYEINNASPYRVLEALQNNPNFGIHSYFVDSVLHVGFASDLKPSNPHQYNLHRNVRSHTGLEFKRQSDYKIQFKAISKNSDGTKATALVGDPNGALRTLHYTGKTSAELKALAESKLNSLVFDGYTGSYSAFGIPRVKAGDGISITDPDYPDGERTGEYLVESVTKYFDERNGFKNEISPSLKLT